MAKFAKTAVWLSEINDVAHQSGSSDTVKAEEIAGLIDSFVDDESAWRYKYKEAYPQRKLGIGRLGNGKGLITSYVGIAYNWDYATDYNVSSGSSNTSEVRLFAPIGVEYAYLMEDKFFKTIGLNVSPLDIGVPFSNELFDEDGKSIEDYSFKSIFSPSLFLALSGTDASMLIGIQQTFMKI